MVGDISYVGNHGVNRLGAPRTDASNLNAVDFGAAYLPQNQDPTAPAQHGTRGVAYHVKPAPGLQGLGNINE